MTIIRPSGDEVVKSGVRRRTLIVGGLPPGATELTLGRHISRVAPVESITILRGGLLGRPRRWLIAVVILHAADDDLAVALRELDGARFKGQRVHLQSVAGAS